MPSTNFILASAALAAMAHAKTDLTGCTTTDMSSPAGASVAWYVPGTGELCDSLDCGGGRAPVKSDVPGCPAYTGTETYSPSYLAGYGSATANPSVSYSSVTGLAQPAETNMEAETSDARVPAYANPTMTSGPTSAAEESAASSSSFNWDSLISEADTRTTTWDLYAPSDSSAVPDSETTSADLDAPSSTPSAASSFTGPTDKILTSVPPLSTVTSAGAPYVVAGNNTVAGGAAGSTGGVAGGNNGTATTSADSSSTATIIPGNDAGVAKGFVSGAGLMVAVGAIAAAL